MANETSKTSLLNTARYELSKTVYFYDVSRRNTYIVQARRDAGDGDPCLVTKYTYSGVNIEPTASTEYEGEWDVAWDVVEDTPS